MKSYLNFIVLILTTLLVCAQSVQPVPNLTARVTDLADLLTPSQQNSLSAQLQALEERKGSQVAVLIVNTTAPETIEQFSIRVVDQWKLGRDDVDDGVLLLVAKNDRKLRIEVGYGLEGAITDAYAKRIISNIIVPHFRDGDYFLGIEEGVEAIVSLIDGEELPNVTRTDSFNVQKNYSLGLFLGIVLLIFGLFISKALLTKKVGGSKTNFILLPLVFLITWILASLSTAITVTIFASVFLNMGGGSGRGGRRGRYYGGYSGGWSSGGGGFGGGFSGGGGGFGGGGASGSW